MNIKNFLIHVSVKLRGYQIDGNTLLLPFGHMLPIYQKNFSHYDRTLPKIISKKSQKIVFIDIGANVGDTLFSLIVNKHKLLQYHAIDGSEFFYKYLKKNVNRLQDKDWIYCYNNIITRKKDQSINQNHYGTGKIERGHKAPIVDNITLSEFLAQNIDVNDNLFIKIDVDGYDRDVLLSGMEHIQKWFPELFFECDFDPSEREKYLELLMQLFSLGYSLDFYDNFGQLVVRDANIETANFLFSYRDSQFSSQFRTIYYFDVHAYK